MKAALREVFRAVDLLLTPTTPTVAPAFPTDPAETPGRSSLRNTGPFNTAGLPAISLPCGFADGLPIGLQLVGRWWEEGTALRAAHAYQQSTDWHRRRPTLDQS
jgi:aspartyl-tRNA(Asn)/glutamyl-tRNA(Gln) amidotransferase subunit A